MDWLDDELKRAFERQQPPPGFAARTIARAAQGWRLQFPRWAVAAAAVLAIAGAGYGYRCRRGEEAKQEVLLAFRITATKVNHIQTEVLR